MDETLMMLLGLGRLLRAARMAASRAEEAEGGSTGRERVRGPRPSTSAAEAECLRARRPGRAPSPAEVPRGAACSTMGEERARLGPTLLSRSRPHAHHESSTAAPDVRSPGAGDVALSDEPGEEGTADPPQSDQASACGARLTVGDPSLSLRRMSTEEAEAGPIWRAETCD